MTTNELILVKQIFTENPVYHTVRYNKDKPVDFYTILAEYKNAKNTVQKDVLTFAHTPATHLCETYIGEKCAYAKFYQKLTTISINPQALNATEDSIIGDIIKICKEKSGKKYANQLKQIQMFLTQLKEQSIQK